jgi:hypothetical protein
MARLRELSGEPAGGASRRKELPMSNQTTEELLLAGMERFTADVTPPSGLAVRAARHRRRRIAAATAVAVIAAVAVAVAGPARSASHLPAAWCTC